MLVILLVALSNFLVGSIMGPGSSEQKQAKGFLGYDCRVKQTIEIQICINSWENIGPLNIVDLIRENWSPGYTFTDGQMQDFFSVFSVYFPAGIGILSGANVSGDLKVTPFFFSLKFKFLIHGISTSVFIQDPNSAIPKGTILAICITSLSYAIVAIICGATMKRAGEILPP